MVSNSTIICEIHWPEASTSGSLISCSLGVWRSYVFMKDFFFFVLRTAWRKLTCSVRTKVTWSTWESSCCWPATRPHRRRCTAPYRKSTDGGTTSSTTSKPGWSFHVSVPFDVTVMTLEKESAAVKQTLKRTVQPDSRLDSKINIQWSCQTKMIFLFYFRLPLKVSLQEDRKKIVGTLIMRKYLYYSFWWMEDYLEYFVHFNDKWTYIGPELLCIMVCN